jgi:hypothetical protein
MISLRQLTDKIFLFEVDNNYDLAMYFLRAQEYYECPNNKFRGKIFKLVDYMEWYVKQYEQKSFTYPADWDGFNIPGRVIYNVYENSGDLIEDWNKYDEVLYELHNLLSTIAGRDYYLIGTVTGSNSIKHELAHGLWATDPGYKEAMVQCLCGTKAPEPWDILKQLRKNVMDEGYHEDVVDDEVQAYLATGVVESIQKDINTKKLKAYAKQFVNVFEKWSKLVTC